ncbi:MAG: pyridoxine 5'-phosphate synthase [Verrucomicrobia bacterium]|nr:pyridoxine 5'-phosphate synthase [Verrucomicrobiota bacterium]
MYNNYIRLGVNIDHCATVRQARYRNYERLSGGIVEPDPLFFALLAERAGADGITVHPRADGRHIQRGDVERLCAAIQIPLNMEMGCTREMVAFAVDIKPRTVCLVPETRDEVTTEGGLDIAGQTGRVLDVVEAMHANGTDVSLFIDPEPEQIECAAKMKVRFVELHTGSFANGWHSESTRVHELAKIRAATELAQQYGITVNLGHGINYTNVADLRSIPGIHEMNIGHTIVARALMVGVEEAVKEMRRRMNPGLF